MDNAELPIAEEDLRTSQEAVMRGETPRRPFETLTDPLDWYRPEGLVRGLYTLDEIRKAREKARYSKLPHLFLGLRDQEGKRVLDMEGIPGILFQPLNENGAATAIPVVVEIAEDGGYRERPDLQNGFLSLLRTYDLDPHIRPEKDLGEGPPSSGETMR
ncbi:MAG: hypothetical protein HY426_03620 [Candidatus Levybacteria bacterium]|nr:hypothetical protein [Candidatus Levybacteria bacterium]